ncbi:filamentous hemagglutinin outer membrane protein [Fischerella sp. NIES-4106]|nr:filamentous hemagglutinin outer membrane protein [Fischerella sp. NIES-4106]
MRSLFVILPLVSLGWLASINTVRAQEVSSDRSLSTTVRSDGSNFIIENGNRAGGNLFHSFSQFSVPDGRSAVFQNPVDVQNIISRVTGGSISNIDGLIRANGSANLFLINPAGIAFGPNARLNIGGSFFATTANSLLFGDGVEFSATNLATPPVLTVNIPIGLRFRDNPGNITTNRFVASDGTVSGSILPVQPGKTLALIGGNINIDAGILYAPGGRIELGGLTQVGTVGLNPDSSLSFPDGVKRGDISFTNGVIAYVSAGDGGSIAVNARNIEILKGSQLVTGILFGLGSVGSQAGDITLNAAENITIADSGSVVNNNVNPGAVGNGGNINIQARSLSLNNGGVIRASTFGQGNAGSININVNDTVSLNSEDSNSFIFNNVLSNAVGSSGGINITTGSLSLTNVSQIQSGVKGEGNSGKIRIVARDSVTLDGRNSEGFASGIFTNVETNVEGEAIVNSGGIDITTKSLFMNNAELVSVVLGGRGNSGNISITTDTFVMNNRSQLLTRTFGQGDAGNITINARDIQLDNTSVMNSGVGGVGNGGDIDIQTDSLSLSNGSQINSFIFSGGNGEAGNIKITASDSITLSGIDKDSFSSALFTITERGSSGSAGDIFVKTGNLRITDGAIIGATTSNSGDGGNIFINARNFEALNGGQVVTTSRSSGNAGQITFKVAENMTISGFDSNFQQRLELARNFIKNRPEQRFREVSDIVINEGDASGIFANTDRDSTGKGGSIFIDPKQITIKDGGTITATSAGKGEAGNIELKADNLTLDRGEITVESGNTTGGNIQLDIKDLLLLRRNSQISATAGKNQGGGDGGNVNINTGFLVAFPKEDSDITANAFTGSGGRINIQAESIFGIEPRSSLTSLSDITAISQQNPTLSGTVEIITPDVDPSQGLLELPDNPTDPSSQIAQNPCQQGAGSSFTVIGRGGLPSSPDDGFRSNETRIDLVEPVASSSSSQSSTINQPTTKPTAKQIIPAQGWIFNDKGEVVLTAYDPTTTTAQRTSKPTAACPAPF